MQTPLVCPSFVTTVDKQVRLGVWAGPGQELHVYAEKGFKGDGYDGYYGGVKCR